MRFVGQSVQARLEWGLRSTNAIAVTTWDNAFLIYNPKAGKFNRDGGRLLQRTIGALETGGHRVTAVPTPGPNTAASVARSCIAKGADLIISCGGDGTLNEVANGVIGTEVPMAILPGGTANVMCVELGVGTNLVSAAHRLGTLVPERIAAGRMETEHQSRYFLLMAGAGFDAMIVYNVDAALKARIGRAAYWLSGFSTFGRTLPEFDVRANGHLYRCSFALTSRVRNYGGDLWIARGASLFSEHFEIVLFEGPNSMPYVKYLLGAITGRLSGMRGISIVKADTVEIESPSGSGVYVQVDGEYAGRLPATLRIVPRALTLLMPPEFLNRRQTVAANGRANG